MKPDASISVVLPTFNRAAALRRTFDSLLALRGVGEIVAVDDGSTDGTARVLAERADGRVRVVRLERNGGVAAARNHGAALVRGEWVLFAEDDCLFPPDYATVLREEAEAHGADVVGAPMVHVAPGEQLGERLARARAERAGPNGLDRVAGFPGAPTLTPLLPAPALVRRSALRALRFDEGYGGSAYREETDFFVRAARRGMRCLLTPRTYFWEERRWPGGHARPGLLDELWTLRNNWRFLRRHGRWLAEQGHIASPLREQLSFVRRRLSRRWRWSRGGRRGRG